MTTATKTRPTAVSAVDYKKTVDRLQSVRARVKELNDEADKLRKTLLDGKQRRYHGTYVDAVVVTDTQERLDTKAIREDMDDTWIANHTQEVPVTKIELEPHTM